MSCVVDRKNVGNIAEKYLAVSDILLNTHHPMIPPALV
jgi:hypothetical protein